MRRLSKIVLVLFSVFCFFVLPNVTVAQTFTPGGLAIQGGQTAPAVPAQTKEYTNALTAAEIQAALDQSDAFLNQQAIDMAAFDKIVKDKTATPEARAEAKTNYDASLAKAKTAMQAKNAQIVRQNTLTQQAINNEEAGGVCLGFHWTSALEFHPEICAAKFSTILLKISAFVLWIAGQTFDWTLGATLNFSAILKDLKVVDTGWGIFRDLANIFFLFVLLFVAIGIILDTDKLGGKKLIGSVILMAILINFSLFFTKALVDVSNILALQFYGRMTAQGSANSDPLDPNASPTQSGISGRFMKGLNLSTIYDAGGTSIDNLSTQDTGAVANVAGTGVTLSPRNILIVGIFGSILMLVTAFVFFAGVILFLIRTITLIILMILSPLAFVAQVVPGAEQHAKKWWSKLIEQCLFAPVYMAMIYVVVSSIPEKGAQGAGFSQLFTGNSNGIPALFSFGVLIALMISSLLVAATLGAKGAGVATSTLKSVSGGFAGGMAAGLVGRTAASMKDANWFKASLGKSQLISRSMEGVAGAKFGGQFSWRDAQKDAKKRNDEHEKYLGTSKKVGWQGTAEATYKAQAEEDQKAKNRVNKHQGVVLDKDTKEIVSIKNRSWSSALGGAAATARVESAMTNPAVKKAIEAKADDAFKKEHQDRWDKTQKAEYEAEKAQAETAETALEVAKTSLETAREAFKNRPTPANEDTFKEAVKTMQEARDKHVELKNVADARLKKREWTKEDKAARLLQELVDTNKKNTGGAPGAAKKTP